jgi:hypothetical protein
MLRKILTTAILAGLALEANASLTTGDIAFTSFNADEDGWAIVNFVDIAANTTIYFNDNEWNGSSFNTGEGFHTWNSGLSTIAAGTVVRFNKADQPSRSVSIGTYSATGDTGLNATSETIYAFLGTGTTTPTTFLAGVSTEGSANLTPAGLSSGVNAVVLTNSADFGQYTGDRSTQANFADYRSLVNTAANWNIVVGGSQESKVPNTTNFTVAAVPVPAAVWLFGSALAGLGVINRRKNKI